MRAASPIGLAPTPRWRAAARRAGQRVVEGVAGRVLALDPETARRLRAVPTVREVIELAGPDGAPGAVDHAVGAFVLAGHPRLRALLTLVHAALVPDGSLHFCELVPGPGLPSRLATPLRLPAPLGTWFPSNDVPAEVRRAGFTITDIERFDMPTLVAPLRHAALGVARPSRWRS